MLVRTLLRLVLVLGSSLCSLTILANSDLTRAGAANLLVASQAPELTQYRQTIYLHREGISMGAELGWWQIRYGLGESLSPAIQADVERVHGMGYLILKRPVELSFEVTGIASSASPSVKTVEFNWKYKNLTPQSRVVAVEGGTGKASFQLYDDGWRVAAVMAMRPGETPFPVSTQEREATLRAIETERTRRNSAARTADEARQAFQARSASAQTPTRTVSSHNIAVESATFGKSTADVSVSDVGVKINLSAARGKVNNTYAIPFARMDRHSGLPAGYSNNDYLYIGGVLVSVSRSAKGSPEYRQVVDAVNGSFETWKAKYADVVSSCPNSRTWGCVTR